MAASLVGVVKASSGTATNSAVSTTTLPSGLTDGCILILTAAMSVNARVVSVTVDTRVLPVNSITATAPANDADTGAPVVSDSFGLSTTAALQAHCWALILTAADSGKTLTVTWNNTNRNAFIGEIWSGVANPRMVSTTITGAALPIVGAMPTIPAGTGPTLLFSVGKANSTTAPAITLPGGFAQDDSIQTGLNTAADTYLNVGSDTGGGAGNVSAARVQTAVGVILFTVAMDVATPVVKSPTIVGAAAYSLLFNDTNNSTLDIPIPVAVLVGDLIVIYSGSGNYYGYYFSADAIPPGPPNYDSPFRNYKSTNTPDSSQSFSGIYVDYVTVAKPAGSHVYMNISPPDGSDVGTLATSAVVFVVRGVDGLGALNHAVFGYQVPDVDNDNQIALIDPFDPNSTSALMMVARTTATIPADGFDPTHRPASPPSAKWTLLSTASDAGTTLKAFGGNMRDAALVGFRKRNVQAYSSSSQSTLHLLTVGGPDLVQMAVTVTSKARVDVSPGYLNPPSATNIAVTLTTRFRVEVGWPAYGSVASPVYVVPSGTTVVDLDDAVYQYADPAPIHGDAAAPSIWLSFVTDDDYMAAVTIDGDAEMEIWVGPNYAIGGMNVRLLGWTAPDTPIDLSSIEIPSPLLVVIDALNPAGVTDV